MISIFFKNMNGTKNFELNVDTPRSEQDVRDIMDNCPPYEYKYKIYFNGTPIPSEGNLFMDLCKFINNNIVRNTYVHTYMSSNNKYMKIESYVWGYSKKTFKYDVLEKDYTIIDLETKQNVTQLELSKINKDNKWEFINTIFIDLPL